MSCVSVCVYVFACACACDSVCARMRAFLSVWGVDEGDVPDKTVQYYDPDNCPPNGKCETAYMISKG